MPIKIIAFYGKKQSGKDTAAAIFKEYIKPPHRAVTIGFADALKDELCSALRVTRQYLEEHKQHFRLIMQGYGTDYKRNLINTDYWVRKWLEKVHELQVSNHTTYIIVNDLRFKNEYDAIKFLFGTVIQVTRPHEVDMHVSEIEQDYFKPDLILSNNTTIQNLREQIKANINNIL